MTDNLKLIEQLKAENESLRRRVAKYEKMARKCNEAEKALRQIGERYRHLFEFSPDPIVIHSEGKIIDLNAAAIEFAEIESKDEVIGKPLLNFVHPDYRDLAKKRTQAIIKNGKSLGLIEEKFITPGGKVRDVEVVAVPFFDRNKITVQVAFRDISEKKQVVKSLRESEARYRLLFDHAADYILIFDPFHEGGPVIVDANEAACKVHGYTYHEFIGKSIFELEDEESRKMTEQRVQKIISGEILTFESTHIRKDGSRFPVEVSARLIELGGRPLVYAIERDITERKIAETKLRESEESYRGLFNNATDAIYIQDREGKFLDVNQGAVKMYGYPREYFIGKLPDFLSAPGKNDFEAVQEKIQAAFGGEPQRFEFWGLRKNGEIFPKEVRLSRGTYFGQEVVIAFAQDITERKQAEIALRESEEKYRNLIESSNDAIYLLYDGKFEIINDKFQQMLGVTLEEVNQPDFNFMDLVAPSSKNMILERERRIKNGEKVKNKYEFTAVSKFGVEIEVEASVSYLKYKDGLATQGILRDISERKKLEAQLLQSQKMEAIGRLAGGVAHDFNNLLTVITGYSQLIISELSKGDPIREDIEEIKHASDRAAILTQQLLAFSRKQVLNMKVLDLNSIIENMKNMIRRLIGEEIELQTILTPGIGYIKVDSGQIEQVILNLAVNAKDAMPDGGKLIIETQNIKIDESFVKEHGFGKPGRYIQLDITDSGVGMDEATIANIFDPFFTTKPVGKGTGLGLSTVYGIVRQSGGYIWVSSEPENGTSFKICFPVVKESPGLAQIPEEPIKKFRGNETVLLVEDEKLVRDLAHTTLKRYGYNVLVAQNAGEALIISEKFKNKIHLILTDVVMPQMNGNELVERLKISRADMKVLYMSGYTDGSIVKHGILEKGVNLIQKPFAPKDVLAKVRKVLDG